MITAQEARARAECSSNMKNFLALVEEKIKKAVEEEKFSVTFAIYNQAIGDVGALYNRENEDKALTEAGKIAVKELRDAGYKVALSLYYEERQFVDMRLQFTISW